MPTRGVSVWYSIRTSFPFLPRTFVACRAWMITPVPVSRNATQVGPSRSFVSIVGRRPTSGSAQPAEAGSGPAQPGIPLALAGASYAAEAIRSALAVAASAAAASMAALAASALAASAFTSRSAATGAFLSFARGMASGSLPSVGPGGVVPSFSSSVASSTLSDGTPTAEAIAFAPARAPAVVFGPGWGLVFSPHAETKSPAAKSKLRLMCHFIGNVFPWSRTSFRFVTKSLKRRLISRRETGTPVRMAIGDWSESASRGPNVTCLETNGKYCPQSPIRSKRRPANSRSSTGRPQNIQHRDTLATMVALRQTERAEVRRRASEQRFTKEKVAPIRVRNLINSPGRAPRRPVTFTALRGNI
ncbi:MAG: hypothetical protein ACI9OJ_002423 [Myxococcota bacterium]